jgi:hypothetical protein
MKKVSFIVGLAFVISLTFYAIKGNAQMGSGMMGQGMLGGGMMGNGITGGGQMGQGMGSGMGNPGYGNQYGPQSSRQYQEPQKQHERGNARTILENYLNSTRNPNLKLGKIKDP